MTVPQTEATLLSYFQSGDHPTAEQFEEFIRTMFYLASTTQAAVEDVTDMVSGLSLVVAAGRMSGATAIKQIGCTVVRNITGTGPVVHRYAVTFSSPRPTANYIILTDTGTSLLRSLANITVNGFEIVYDGSLGTLPSSMYFAVFDNEV